MRALLACAGVIFASGVLMLAGCGGGGGSGAPQVLPSAGPTFSATATPLASATPATTFAKVSPGGQTVSVSANSGISASIVLPKNNAVNGTVIQIQLLPGTPTGAPQPANVRRYAGDQGVILSLEVLVTANLTFNASPSLTLTLPSSISTSGETFELNVYGGTSSSAPLLEEWGPGAVSGANVTFSSSLPTSINSSTTYLLELYESPNATPSPSSGPSTSPTSSASPTPTPTATPTPHPPPPTPTPTSTPAGNETISLSISGTPVAMAYQSGTGAWTALSSGQTSFTVSGNAYGFAYSCGQFSSATNGYSVVVLESTASELNNVLVPCGSSSSTGTLSGTISYNAFCGSDPAATAYIDGEPAPGCNGGSYSVSLQSGTQDIFTAALDGNNNLLAVNTVQNATVPGTLGITFGSGDAVGSAQSVAQLNVPITVTSSATNVLFGSFENWIVPLGNGNATSTSYEYAPVSSNDIGANDSYLAQGWSYLSGPGTASLVGAQIYQQTPPQTIGLTAPFSASVTSGGSPTLSLNYSGFGSLSGGIWGYGLIGDWIGLTTGNVVGFVTSGYLQASGSTNYAIPNITLSGFPAMAAASTDSYSWRATALYGPPQLFGAVPFSEVLPAVSRRSSQAMIVRNAPMRATRGRYIRPMLSAPSSGGIYYAEASGTFTVP